MTVAAETSAKKSPATADRPTLATLIRQMSPEIAKVLPAHMNPTRMGRIATTMVRQTPLLARCTPETFLGALLSASQLGLEPGPTGECYFLPFRNGKSGSYEVQFIVGWRGLVKLARNSGQLVDIWSEIVYEHDTFRYSLGLHRDLVHEPAVGDRGKMTHVYAAAKLRDGGTPFVVLTVADVEKLRSRSRASGNGPWVTDYEAMSRKSAVRQLAKWLPLSAEMASAVALDGSVRTDVGDLVDVTPTFIDGEVDDTPPAPVDDETAALDAARDAEESA